jgi:hypothetical protein
MYICIPEKAVSILGCVTGCSDTFHDFPLYYPVFPILFFSSRNGHIYNPMDAMYHLQFKGMRKYTTLRTNVSY